MASNPSEQVEKKLPESSRMSRRVARDKTPRIAGTFARLRSLEEGTHSFEENSMSFLTFGRELALPSRRAFLGVSGAALSGTAIALLAGKGALAAASDKHAEPANDVAILNSALAAELEAIAAYGVGAGSGLLKGAVLALAGTFQGHHKQHADVLAGAVTRLGGRPNAAKPSYSFPVETLKTQNDVLRFAANLEKGAVSAYLGAVRMFHERELSKAAASILGDEAMHWAVLRQAVGEDPVPAAFVS
jgi:bacterioferritin (cytochrome b1)